jgi:maltokinase
VTAGHGSGDIQVTDLGNDAAVTGALEQFVGSARWFGGKGRDFSISGVRRLGFLGEGECGVRVGIELATVQYDDGASELYQLPLAYYTDPQERLEHALVGQWQVPDLGPVFVYDALHDRHATALWLEGFHSGKAGDDLVFHRLEGHELDLESHSSLFSGEQSNSSVAFGEDSLMKVFRKVTPGRNPDIEIHEALTKADNDHVAALYGWLEAPGHGEEEPLQLAMLQQFLRTASDGWELALASVRDLFAEGDLHADEVGGDFAAESQRLGVALAEVHDALEAQFATQSWGPSELVELSEAMKRRLTDAVDVVPELREHAAGLREAFDALATIDDRVVVQRIHGDLHLGQTLRTVKGWKIVDFEGEPAKPLAERVRSDSAWRDVAGMLRSFDYAAHAVESDVEEGAQIAYRALEWVQRNRAAFLEGYVEASGRTTGGTLSTEQELLLRAYEFDKAVYEMVYEARNRPDWIKIPLAAIARLTRPSQRDHQEASNS